VSDSKREADVKKLVEEISREGLEKLLGEKVTLFWSKVHKTDY